MGNEDLIRSDVIETLNKYLADHLENVTDPMLAEIQLLNVYLGVYGKYPTDPKKLERLKNVMAKIAKLEKVTEATIAAREKEVEDARKAAELAYNEARKAREAAAEEKMKQAMEQAHAETSEEDGSGDQQQPEELEENLPKD